jgi:tetratricopeptide (TPR) repeat protein
MENRKPSSFILSLLLIILLFLMTDNVWAQKGRFKGIVKDEQGKPIEGANILVENPLHVSGRIEAKTDKNGVFSFLVPVSGVWKFTILAKDYNYLFLETHFSSVNINKEKIFILRKLEAYEIPIKSAKNIEIFNRAEELYRNNEYKEALELFNQFYQKNSEIYLVNYNIGMCHQKLGEYGEAIESYSRVLAKTPIDSRAIFQIGECYSKIGQINKALEYFEKTIQLKPEDINTVYNIAEILFYANQFEESIHYYKKAIEKNSDFSDCYLKLG